MYFSAHAPCQEHMTTKGHPVNNYMTSDALGILSKNHFTVRITRW